MMQANYALLLRSNQAMDAHTETAMCYFRLSENYEWEFGTDLPQLAMFGPSTPGDRKEEFLIKAVEFFEKGFNLEYAIDACKMLLTLYASFKIDFIKLSRWHKRIADLYERIAKGESSIDNYFRIIFIGKDFPQSIQNKSFICHMGSCATLGNTVSLLKKHFPNAKIPSTSFIDEKLYEQNVQYIFVQAYQPLPKDFQLYERYYLASATVSRFYKNAGTDQFQGTTTIEHKKGDGSQPTLSFIKTLVKLGYDLPSIILVSPITVEEKTKITEFEQNIDMVRDNANELLDLVRSYDLNPLMLKTIQMKLSGCLNAFVNGGLSLILPENADGLDVMRNALYQFMSAISCSMKLLFKNVPDELAGFVLNLFESYQVTRSSLQQKANVESEDLSSFIQSSTSVNPPSAPVSSGRKGSIMSRGSNMDLTSGSSSIKEVDIVPEMQKKEKGFTIRSIRAFKSPKATLLDEKSSVFSGAFQEKLNHGESKENLAAISPGDKKKNKYGIFNRKKS
ncbi:Dedicator of cytokinesis protein 3 [Thelohanellus kitauei]|uniref:Dedicator of cytokinesis protein 3 n=1 Tax=Thelohanellus kitauei TaxID=669202 RepID=A0A0C2MBE8_THEKT|nr:Dedicator of cytokinesis protein 3 [Thelohanellus kitauei]